MTKSLARPSASTAKIPSAADGTVVSLHHHPTFLRRQIARNTAEVLEQVAKAQASLDRIHTALTRFREQLAESRASLQPTRADCAATLAALNSGDVAEMERVRDAILKRMEAEGR